MAEPTLQQVFGADAIQDNSSLTIQKSALVNAGLTANGSNKAEQLLVAILKLAAVSLTSTSRDSDITQSIAVDTDNTPIFTFRTDNGTTATYIRDTITVELDKAYNSVGIDPDDY